MSPAYTHGTGQPITIIDKTRKPAAREYVCDWDPSHIIKKGEVYIRVGYRIGPKKVRGDHICLECWCGAITDEDNG